MTLSISLPADAEIRLKERAQAAGQDVAQYVEQLLTKELVAPLRQATKPLARTVTADCVMNDS
jgi:hypothetical protein